MIDYINGLGRAEVLIVAECNVNVIQFHHFS